MFKFNKNTLSLIIIILIFLSIFCVNVKSNSQYLSSDLENLTFKQELMIPIDTSQKEAKFQPIDIKVDFSNPCYAKDETSHSIRIGYENGKDIFEIDSQVYNIEYSDNSYIKSCNIVFLIPEEANGKEKYYVFYDSKEIQNVEYEDHLKIEDTNYFYEPISGQKIQFDYYGISQDEYTIYGIIQKGEIIGNPVSQNIVKIKPDSKKLDTTRIDQLAAFDFRYGINGEPDYTGTGAATEVTKSIIVDGNLMIRVRIVCFSPINNIKTDNIYTYYYCPTDTKRIYVNVNHDVIETINIQDPEVLDGIYSGIISIKSRSNTIENMNVGYILPSFHLYDEDDTIVEYSIPPDPKSVEKELILSTEDDIDLGSKAWVSLSDPETGKTHGLILNSNTGITNDELDGIQIKSYVKENIKLPGLEADTGSVFLGRNAYDKGKDHLTAIPKDFSVNFGVVFITNEKEGYQRVDSESEIIQNIIKNIPIFRGNVTEDNDEEEKFQLTTLVHFAPSALLGSLPSALIGKNIPYIYAELYKENNFKSSGSVVRLPLGEIDLDLEGKNFFQKIKTIIGLFDWENATFFKKIKFPNLEPGTYVVKIFRENRFFEKQKQYIGFAIVELKRNKKIHIYCRPEGTVECTIFDQNKKGVENVKFSLKRNGITISNDITDKNGTVNINAPIYPTKPYTFSVIYKGFLIKEKELKLGLFNNILPIKETFFIKHYELTIKVKDKWGFPPEISINPTVTSNEMIEPISISPNLEGKGIFVFSNLYPSSYVVNMKYKSFDLQEDILIDDKDHITDITFPAEFEINFDVMNTYGYVLNKGDILISRDDKSDKKSIDKNGKAIISVPPGEYDITVFSENKKIAQQTVKIMGDKKIDILSSQESFLNNLVIYFGIILAIFSIIFMVWKRKFITGIKLFIIALLIISIFSPWWVLNGENKTSETSTKTLLVPPKIITFSSSKDVMGGDISQVPSEVTIALNLLSILILIICVIILFTIIIKNKLKRSKKILSILSIILLVVTLSLFYYVMSQITDVGVGSFIGNDDIKTTLPGIAESEILSCSWGPGLGFYLGLLSIIILILLFLFNKKIIKIKEITNSKK